MSSATREFQHCRRCGRVLRGEASRARGFGPKCAAKSGLAIRVILEEQGQMTFDLKKLGVDFGFKQEATS